MAPVMPRPAANRVPLPTQYAMLIPALTPLHLDRTPDLASLERLIDFHAAAGINGMLVAGSSGESVSLARADRIRVVEHAVRYAAGRLHIMAGISTYGLADAATEVSEMATVHPDSLLVAPPAGLHLSPDELADHYRAIAARTDIPLVAYDVPARVGSAIEPVTIGLLAREGVIAGVKDSSTDLTKARLIVQATRDLADFVRYTGGEYNIDATLLTGYQGAIPGLANVFPEFHVALARRAAAADWVGAAQIQAMIVELLVLYDAPLSGGSASAAFFAATKEALRQKAIFQTNTSSAPMVQSTGEVADYVEGVIQVANRLAARLATPVT